MTKAAPKAKVPAKPIPPEYSDAQRETAARAAAWVLEQRKARGQPLKLQSTVKDRQISLEVTPDQAPLLDVFLFQATGSLSRPFVDGLTVQLMNMHGAVNNDTPMTLNSALAVLHSMKPANELEAMLIANMIGLQDFFSHTLFLARKADMRDARDQYGNMANKTARTMAALVDSLTKLRSGGKQQVEVRHVYIDARTQTVVNGPQGGGGDASNSSQPHGQCAGLAYALGSPVWGEDAARDGLPGSGDQGSPEVPLPRVRRPESRRSARPCERALQHGAAHEGHAGASGGDTGPGKKRSRGAG